MFKGLGTLPGEQVLADIVVNHVDSAKLLYTIFTEYTAVLEVSRSTERIGLFYYKKEVFRLLRTNIAFHFYLQFIVLGVCQYGEAFVCTASNITK